MTVRDEVLIIPTGVANLASVRTGFERIGATVRVTRDAGGFAEARYVVLPGVGAFAAGMRQLHADGLVDTLRKRIENQRPTLAVCLGLQLLCAASEEDPGVEGLGVIDDTVSRFPETVLVPQLGWNEVEPDADCALLESGYAYFANSYRLVDAPAGWRAAYADHGGRFVAALERGPVLACQFHPELSGAWGLALLRRWLQGGA